jgi:GTP-binding protein
MNKTNSLKTKTLPKVVLLGRTNVGKSTLFNRLTETPTALISPQAGTTRDYQTSDIEWAGKKFTLIDTGGLSTDKKETINYQISEKSLLATKQAKLLLMVVDGKTGLLPEDYDVFKTIKKIGKPCFLVITKLDNAKKWSSAMLDWSELGIEKIYTVSGVNGIGTGNLLDAITEFLPKKLITSDENEVVMQIKPIRLAIIGKPNVGKSSLINSLLGFEKQIVSSQAHTTRGAQDVALKLNNRHLILTDTAGIRRQVKKSDKLEKYSIEQTLHKIKNSDITLLILDISVPLTFQDKHLTEHAVKSGNSMMIVANKWDLIPDKDETTMNTYTKYIFNTFPHLTWAPIIFTSALTKQRTKVMLEKAVELYEKRFTKVSDSAMQKFLKRIINKHPPARGKGAGHPYIYHIKQVGVNPPAFQVTIKYKKSLHGSYLRFIENNLRAEFDFIGTPLRLFITSVK